MPLREIDFAASAGSLQAAHAGFGAMGISEHEVSGAFIVCDIPAMTLPNTLILGANGFAGNAVASHLAAMGRPVLAYGRSPLAAPGIEAIQGSIEDTSLLREAISRCSLVVHVASMTTPGTSARDPSLEVVGNLLPLASILECAEAYPNRRLVYLSSGGAIYGDLADGASESTALSPRSYYGAGKVAAEAMIHACTVTSTWSARVLRPSNLYGPGQAVARGFAIVPTLFERALDGDAFTIWGDGSTVRDYCYVDDLVGAVEWALQDASPIGFAAYNVASGRTASILQLVELCERTSDRRIARSFMPARGVDVPRVALDASELRRLGWHAKINLEEGLMRTWNWFRALRANEAQNAGSSGR